MAGWVFAVCVFLLGCRLADRLWSPFRWPAGQPESFYRGEERR